MRWSSFPKGPKGAFFAATLVAGSLACTGGQRIETRAPARTSAAEAALLTDITDKRAVEAGTTFGATLQDPIGTLTSREGDRFALRIDEDIRARDGSVVIRSGSTLNGRVVRIEADERGLSTLRERSPGLWVKLESIDGRPVNVTMVDAEGYATVGAAREGADHDAILLPPIGPRAVLKGAPFGGGPPSDSPHDDHVSKPHHVLLPEGAKVQLMIQAPLR